MSHHPNHEPVLTVVRKGHEFNMVALRDYLEANLGGDWEEISIRQFEGGQSNPTFQIQRGRKERYVIRKKPPGKLLRSAHMVEREYRIMKALQNTAVPVPEALLLCEDESVIGTPFFVMKEVEGRVVSDPSLPGFSEQERADLYDHLLEILAGLHSLDYQALGLADFGKPGNYYERQISRWTKQYLASQTDDIKAMEELMAWLPQNVPPSDETTIVHGDFRIGNVIIHPTKPQVAALLDWELSTLGHPMADLGYSALHYYYIHGSGGAPFPAGERGLPTEDDFTARYANLSGRDPREHWTFTMVFQLFRLAGIIQGVVKRGMDGQASSARWSDLRNDCRKLAETARGLIG